MKSQHFEFLRRRHPELADLGGFAEAYARPDPSRALSKLRSFIENVVTCIYDEYRLPRPGVRGEVCTEDVFDLLDEPRFRAAVPPAVLNRLQSIRRAGNQATHRDRGRVATGAEVALKGLREAFEIAQWVHLHIDRGERADFPVFKASSLGPRSSVRRLLLALGERPPRAAADGAALEKARKNAQAKLAEQEEMLRKVLADLAEERRKREATESGLELTAERLEALRAEGQNIANVLCIHDKATDPMLIDPRVDYVLFGAPASEPAEHRFATTRR